MQKPDLALLFDTEIGKHIYKTAIKTIRDNAIEEKLSGGVLVGFSGGADSVMLLCFLKRYSEQNGKFNILAVHVNHMIRGAEADRDEKFSREFCRLIGVDFVSYKRDVPSISKELSKGLEEAARDVRYSIFTDILQGRNDISCVAVAHNSTDNLETVLFNLMRGAGTRGLSGISPVRDDIVRPLIRISKRDIVSALEAVSIPYVVDSTNLETDYTRNYIRSEILPKLSKLSDNPEAQAVKASENLRTDDAFISSYAEDFVAKYKDGVVPHVELSCQHPAVLFRVLQILAKRGGSSGLEHNHIEKIRELLLSGGAFSLSIPGEVSFISDGKICFVGNKTAQIEPNYNVRLSLGINDVEEIGVRIILSEHPIENFYSNVYKFSIQQSICSGIIEGELFVRPRKDGDSYVYGKMTRKLKKLFNDKGISPEKRPFVPVFCDEKGILWVPGFRVRDGGAKNCPDKLYIAVLYKA